MYRPGRRGSKYRAACSSADRQRFWNPELTHERREHAGRVGRSLTESTDSSPPSASARRGRALDLGTDADSGHRKAPRCSVTSTPWRSAASRSSRARRVGVRGHDGPRGRPRTARRDRRAAAVARVQREHASRRGTSPSSPTSTPSAPPPTEYLPAQSERQGDLCGVCVSFEKAEPSTGSTVAAAAYSNLLMSRVDGAAAAPLGCCDGIDPDRRAGSVRECDHLHLQLSWARLLVPVSFGSFQSRRPPLGLWTWPKDVRQASSRAQLETPLRPRVHGQGLRSDGHQWRGSGRRERVLLGVRWGDRVIPAVVPADPCASTAPPELRNASVCTLNTSASRTISTRSAVRHTSARRCLARLMRACPPRCYRPRLRWASTSKQIGTCSRRHCGCASACSGGSETCEASRGKARRRPRFSTWSSRRTCASCATPRLQALAESIASSSISVRTRGRGIAAALVRRSTKPTRARDGRSLARADTSPRA